MKIGILTMHRVQNYGSALQAYALQTYINSLGHQAELIDYQYVSDNLKKNNFLKHIIVKILDILRGFPRIVKNHRFDNFYRNFICSQPISDSNKINDSILSYDMYLTGSDQVWNPKFMKSQDAFFFPYIKSKPINSYASSFATSYIERDLEPKYSKLLSRYNYISVREKSGIALGARLTGKKVFLCCDPTFLLSRSSWEKIAKQSRIQFSYKYILVYILSYSYYPYPEINGIVSSIQKKLNLPIIAIDNRGKYLKTPNTVFINNTGPCEFLRLISDAEYVVTTSFHGTAFSMIMERPFLSLVAESEKDTRIQDINSIAKVNQVQNYMNANCPSLSYKGHEAIQNLYPFIDESKQYLQSILEDI